MDLRYVTERIIALWVPGDVGKAAYIQGQQQAASMLRTKHQDNYMVFNLSAPRRAVRHHHQAVREVGWPRDLAPPLERLCSICKDIDSWLKGNPRRIAVVHARGSKDRIGVVVAAYMHYSQICGGADQALDRFAMKRFLQDQVEDVEQPSHRRYVDYFSGLLSGSIRINSAPLYLTHVTVLGAPSFEPHHPDGPDPGGGGGGPVGGCRAFLKVYEGLVPVHTSAVYCVAGEARAFTVNVAAERGRKGLQLRGDVLVKCYHRHYRKLDPNETETSRGAREIVFACQFHTCAVSDFTLSFTRNELDYACDDLRFPLDGAVELHFSPTPEPRQPSPAPTPAVPTLDSSDDPVSRWDSYEHLYGGSDEDDDDDLLETDEEVNHTLGPLDGSLYATIGRNKTPQQIQQEQMQQQQHHHQQLQHRKQQQLQLQQDSHLHMHQRRLQQQQQQQQQASPGSEHTVSMDSGISSAGNGHQPASSSGATPQLSDDKQRALDDLLNDMLLTVESFPDMKTTPPTPSVRNDLQRSQRSGGDPRYYRPAAAAGAPPPRRQSSLAPIPARDAAAPAANVANAVRAASGPPLTLSRIEATSLTTSSPATTTTPNTDDDLDEIPYHARLDGRPFTYVPGAAASSNNGLSSPGLVRKASFKEASAPNGHHPYPHHQQQQQQQHHHPHHTHHPSSYDPPSNGYATSTPLRLNGSAPRFIHDADPLLDGPGSRSHLTWLQRQQQKLRERREGVLRSARQPHEARLLSELRSLHHSHSHSASRRLDGYTSDTTMFADEDEEDLCRPLHINTSSKLNGGLSAPGSPLAQPRRAPHQVSASPHYSLSRQRSDSSFDRERPFVAVKRGYEQQRKYHDSALHEAYDRAPSGHLNHYSSAPQPPLRSPAGLQGLQGLHHLNSRAGGRPLYTNHVNGVGNGKPHSGPPSPDDGVLLLDHHPDALTCLMASLAASPSNSPTTSASSMSMTPSPPAVPATPAAPAAPSPISHAQPARPSNASDCSTNSTASCAWQTVQREDSYSSWRSDEDRDSRFSRPQTPAFPVQPRTPYVNNGQQFDSAGLPPKSPTTQRKDRSPSPMSDLQGHGIYSQHSPKSPVVPNGGQSSPTVYSMHSRRSSTHSNSEPPQEVAAHHVKFVRDTSRFWYKPNISREDAIALLREAQPGAFVVRDSNSFPGAFGLALKVAVPPATVAQKAAFFSGDSSELVRHFLIEPTSRGVKLKGCTNEPVFSSLSALVYQHSITAMALPCKLLLPDGEIGGIQLKHVSDVGSSPGSASSSLSVSAQQLLAQGAACNVLYLFTTDTESLTGPQAIRRAVQQLFQSRPLPSATVVHFKVSNQGITLTDNKRRLFFRRHYPVSTISHCGLDPDDHRWSQKSPETGMPISSNRCFGFVARKPASRSDNQCHIFAELEPEQPANAIVNFVTKVMMSGAGQKNVV